MASSRTSDERQGNRLLVGRMQSHTASPANSTNQQPPYMNATYVIEGHVYTAVKWLDCEGNKSRVTNLLIAVYK